jgi:hypothetical protein
MKKSQFQKLSEIVNENRRFLSANERKKIRLELKRICRYRKSKGVFTFLHHDTPLEQANPLFYRLHDILVVKPAKEVLVRLRHIHYIPPHRLRPVMTHYEGPFLSSAPPTRSSLRLAREIYPQTDWCERHRCLRKTFPCHCRKSRKIGRRGAKT